MSEKKNMLDFLTNKISFRKQYKKYKMPKDAIKFLDIYVQSNHIAKNWKEWVKGQYFTLYAKSIPNAVDLEVSAIHLAKKYKLVKKMESVKQK